MDKIFICLMVSSYLSILFHNLVPATVGLRSLNLLFFLIGD